MGMPIQFNATQTEEKQDSCEYNINIDVRYFESLRALNEKIKSCISCNVRECPVIKERLTHHQMKHHSLTNDEQKNMAVKIIRNARPDERSMNKYYKQLRFEILEWSKRMPTYPNQIFEFKKQNLLNLLIENINDMVKFKDDEDYNTKVENAINSFLNSLPGFENGKPLNGELKKEFLDRVYFLNKRFFSDPFQGRKKEFLTGKELNENVEDIIVKTKDIFEIATVKQECKTTSLKTSKKRKNTESEMTTSKQRLQLENPTATHRTQIEEKDYYEPDTSSNYSKEKKTFEKPEVKEVATSTILIKEIFNDRKQANNSTNTVIEYYNEVIGPDIDIYNDAQNNNWALENAQVQLSKSLINTLEKDINPAYNSRTDDIKTEFQEHVLEWMKNLMENSSYNFVNNNVDKNFIIEILWDELKFLMNESINKDCLILKRKILQVLDQMPLSTVKLNAFHKYIISDDLFHRLLNLYSDSLTPHTRVCSYFKDIPWSTKIKIDNVISKVLFDFDVHVDEYVQDEIINILLVRGLSNSKKELIKEELYIFLKTLTDITPNRILELINCLLKETAYLTENLNHPLSKRKSLLPMKSKVAVFASEHDLRASNRGSIKRKASVNETSKLNSEDKECMNNIIDVINHWLDTLPKEFKTSQAKDENVKYLATEIYDQIKLEDLRNDSEKESNKYKEFIVRKWLHRFDFFDDISEADSYIRVLVKAINDIPKTYRKELEGPVVICCGAKRHVEGEQLMKKLILKFLQYNTSEDNPDTRGLFAQLLKSELPNLSIPSRTEVYETFNNLNNGPSSFKKLDKELQYIMLIAECIQDIPLNDTFDNNTRNELIVKFAENIYSVEDDNDDTNNLEDVVIKFVEELPVPILPNYNDNVNTIIDNLLRKINGVQFSRPSCCYARKEIVKSTIDAQNLTDYIESFIRDNSEILVENEIILEACSLRLIKELNYLIVDNPDAFNTQEVYKRMGMGVETVRRFSLELKYAKAISDWLHNLPLLPVLDDNDTSKRTEKVNELIYRMRAYNDGRNEGLTETDLNDNFKRYVERWLISFPLDSRQEIDVPLVIQQLLNIMNRINRENENQKQNNANLVCQAPVPCCSYGKKQKQDPASATIDTIEKWCKDLPLGSQIENVDNLKDTIATKLYQRIGDINNNPLYFDDDNLYRETLIQEIDNLIEQLPSTSELVAKQALLRSKLLQAIMDYRKILKKKISADQYKLRLERKIVSTLPDSISELNDEDPGFVIYKDRLASLFILDNFDYSSNAVKQKYESKIREQINKYYHSALKRNAMSQTKDEMFVELYSALFNVPAPNVDTVSEEVEKIKTKCELEMWFEKLPLSEAANSAEILLREKILSMLAKRLHQMENDVDSDSKIHKEIVKWLYKLPLLVDQEAYIDQYATELQNRLNSTKSMRKCVSQINISKLIEKVNSRTSVPRNESQTQNPLPKCCQMHPPQIKKPADMIIEIVESWCKNLPIPACTQDEKETVKAFKDNAVIKIIMKISELNMNLEIFNDDNLYTALLDDEIENIFTAIPSCCEITAHKNNLKKNLIESIKSVKPLLIEENSRYKYKKELKNIVEEVLDNPENEKTSEIINEIVDNFIIYYYYKNNSEGEEEYKLMITNAVKKYIDDTEDNWDDRSTDPLVKTNQLVCELCKIPCPSNKVILDEVEEIRMKYEVNEFLNEIPISNNSENEQVRPQIKANLARRLSDLEKCGHSSEIEKKMKDEIIKCLRKINENIDTVQIENFIERLRDTELLRKSHSQNPNFREDPFVTPPLTNNSYRNRSSDSKNNSNDDNWMSPLSATPQHYTLNDNSSKQQNSAPCGKCTTPERNKIDVDKKREFYRRPKSANYGLGNGPFRLSEPRKDEDLNSKANFNKNNKDFHLDDFEVSAENFEAGIRITSTPNENTKAHLNYEIFGKSQSSTASYRRNGTSKAGSSKNTPKTRVSGKTTPKEENIEKEPPKRYQTDDEEEKKEKCLPPNRYETDDDSPVRYQISSNHIPSGCSSCRRYDRTPKPCKTPKSSQCCIRRAPSVCDCRKEDSEKCYCKSQTKPSVEHMKKHSKICNTYTVTCRYPGFYYY